MLCLCMFLCTQTLLAWMRLPGCACLHAVGYELHCLQYAAPARGRCHLPAAAVHRAIPYSCLLLCTVLYCIFCMQGMNYVAGSMLLLLGAGVTCQQQQQRTGGGSSSMPSHRSQRYSSSNRGTDSGGGSSSSAALQPPTPVTGSSSSSSVGAAAAPTAAAAGSRPGSRRVTGRSSSSVLAAGSSGGGSTAAAAAAAVMSLEQLESVVFECLMGFAERVLPGYYSPAMVAPQVCVGVVGLVGVVWDLRMKGSVVQCWGKQKVG